MYIYVLDRSLNILDVIEDYESSIWDMKYFDCDDFELYLPATPKNINILQTDRYLVRDKDVISGNMYHVMIIKALEIKTDVENGNYITATGKCLRSILYRRIVWSQTNVSGTVESCIRSLINGNVINPAIAERAISGLVLGDPAGFSETMTKQITGKNLGETITDICTAYGMGWGIYINSLRQMVFYLYKGLDRSDDQSTNPRVTFSNDYDTLLTSDYKLDTDNYGNVALIAGEGEGTARKTTSVGSASGLDRYEIYVDARDQSSNEGEITTTEYYSQLAEKGNEELEKLSYTESFEGEIEAYGNFIYGVDYSLGDIVNVKNEYGITATPRIIGVIESFSTNGESVIPTFSTLKGED